MLFDVQNIHSSVFSSDGRFLVTAYENGNLISWDTKNWKEQKILKSYANRVEKAGILPNQNTLVVKLWPYDTFKLLSLESGEYVGDKKKENLPPEYSWKEQTDIAGVQLTVEKNDEKNNDFVRLRDVNNNELCKIIFLDKEDTWVVLKPDNRFDTNKNLDLTKGLHWNIDYPFKPLPLEIFMRQYFEPGLLPRLLKCNKDGNCDKEFKPLPPIAEINRVQSRVGKPRVLSAK